MVRDIRPEPGFEWGPFAWDEYAEIDGRFYFAADDGVHGRELWHWEPGGAPRMLVDICPGVCPSAPSRLTVLGDRLFFSAEDGTHGREPWLSDGSALGTGSLGDLVPGLRPSWPDFAVAFRGSVYFAATGDDADDRELWRSDGTRAGTERLLDIEPGPVGSDPVSLTVFDDRLYFTARTAEAGRELWTSDGTAAGTAILLDLCDGECDGFWDEQWNPLGQSRVLQPFSGRLLVLAGSNGFEELYAFEPGTAVLTLLHSDIGSNVAPLIQVDGSFFFVGCEQATGCEPWVSDGTPSGTSLVADIRSGPLNSSPLFIGALGSQVVFFADDGISGKEPWRSDGTESGTVPVADIAAGAASSDPFYGFQPALSLSGRLVFRADDGLHGDEFWTTDGTTPGTELLFDAWPGSTGSQTYGGIGHRLLVNDIGVVPAVGPSLGFAYWATDGTPAGTSGFLDSNRQSSSIEPRPIVGLPRLRVAPFGTGALAGANDGVHGDEPWFTDGASTGTHLLADLDPGEIVPGLPAGSDPLYFLDAGGIALLGTAVGVWATGRAEGVVELSRGSIQTPFLPRPDGDGAFYMAYVGGSGSELLETDGTPGGTQVIVSGAEGRLELLDSLLVFSRDTPGLGTELWSYPLPDGPPELLLDIRAGSESSWPDILGRFGDLILFAAFDDVSGYELWATDGTPDGTRLVRDIAPGPAGSSPTVPFDHSAAVTSRGLFFIADDGVSGAELWVSDGQPGGTARVADVWPGPVSSASEHMVAVGDRVFFAADDGEHGREPWIVDGNGARLLRDIALGAQSSMPWGFGLHRMAPLGDRVVFGATDGSRGVELWLSDGSPEGTELLQDIHPGPSSSSPSGFSTAGDRVYFTATDGEHGFEIWSLAVDFEIFEDGFEGGDTSRWSGVVPGGGDR